MLPSKTCSKHCAKPAALGVAKSTRTLSNFYLDGSLSLLLPNEDLPLAGVVRGEAHLTHAGGGHLPGGPPDLP